MTEEGPRPAPASSPTDAPPAPRRSALAFVAGAVVSIVLIALAGIPMTSIAGTIETTPRRSPIAVAVFAVLALVALAGFIRLLRSRTSRSFLIGMCLGAALAALVEGICFMGPG